MKIKRFFVLGCSLLILFLGCSASYAQLIVDKAKIFLVVEPGEKFTDTVKLTNNGNSNLKAKIYMEDFKYTPPYEGTKEFFNAGTQERSNSNWITISPREVTLNPKESRTVSYVVNVPKNVKGGYQGVMIFENLPATIEQNPLLEKDQKSTGVGLSFILRIGTLIFMETKKTVIKPDIGDFVFEGNTLKSNFKNLGEAVLMAETKYYIMDEEGNVVDRADGPKKYLPPGESTELSLKIMENLLAGNYTLFLSMNFGEYESLVREIDFNKNLTDGMSVKNVRE